MANLVIDGVKNEESQSRSDTARKDSEPRGGEPAIYAFSRWKNGFLVANGASLISNLRG